MSQHAKWSQSAANVGSVDELLRAALAAPLHAVARLLRAAARKSDLDSEYVHRLRVATRRAQAVLDLAGDYLPDRLRERTRRRLRKIRRRAGLARDLDVQLASLLQQSPIVPARLRLRIGHRTALLRGRAQAKLAGLAERLGRRKLRRSFDRVVQTVGWQSDGLPPDLPRFVARQTALALVRFDESLTHWSPDLPVLHRIRVAGKRMRYTLEAFAPFFPAEAFDGIHRQLVDLQDAFGQLHDQATMIANCEEWAEHFGEADGDVMDAAETSLFGVGVRPVEWAELLEGMRAKLDAVMSQVLTAWPRERVQGLSATIAAAIEGIASP